MKLLLSIFFLYSFFTFGQSAVIIEKLKLIEAGRADEVLEWYKGVNSDEFEDEAILIIDALLTSDADIAVKKYDQFQKKYPKNNLAPLALFRIYSYYYSLGQYSKAKEYASLLRKRFPNSVYVKNINEVNQKDEKYDEAIADSRKANTEKEDTKIDNNSNSYLIQVGAFSNIDNARKLLKKLQAKKYRTTLAKKNINGLNLNVVYVGNYNSLDDAEQDLKKINREFKVNGKILLTEK